MPNTHRISPQEALLRTIEHREIFHDEMLHIVREIMNGEWSHVMMAAFITGLRVKKETIGEITAAAQVMREFSTKVHVADKTHLVDIVGTGGDVPAAGPPLGGHSPLGGQRSTRSGERGGDIFLEARRIAQCFDSVSVCLSKGLGAPVGSVLCGSRAFLSRAHRIRKMAGGGMRQAGMLAAAGSYALDHHVARLADDHALAMRLAQGLRDIPGLSVELPDTNIVFVDLVGDAQARSAELLAGLALQGVLATAGLYRLRFVTHLDLDAAGIDHVLAVLRDFLVA